MPGNEEPQEQNEEPTLLADALAEAQADKGEKKLATDDGNGEQNTADEEPNEPERKQKKKKKRKKKQEAAAKQGKAADNEEEETALANEGESWRTRPNTGKPTGRPHDDRLHEAFWELADLANPWLHPLEQGEAEWKAVRHGYEEDNDRPIDPWDGWAVFDAVSRWLNDSVPDQRMRRLLVLYVDHLAKFVEVGGKMIPFDDMEAWHRDCEIPWP